MLEFQLKILGFSTRNLRHGSQNCILPVQEKFWWPQICSQKNKKYLEIERKNFWFLANVFWRVVRAPFYVSRGQIWGNFSSEKNSLRIVFRFWEKLSPIFDEKFRHGQENCALIVQLTILNIIFVKEIFVYS